MINKIIYTSILFAMLFAISACRLAGSVEHSGGFYTEENQSLSK
jgi:hypothetical protein